jgi:hypothetical protein
LLPQKHSNTSNDSAWFALYQTPALGASGRSSGSGHKGVTSGSFSTLDLRAFSRGMGLRPMLAMIENKDVFTP